jgi:hypothetical protein
MVIQSHDIPHERGRLYLLDPEVPLALTPSDDDAGNLHPVSPWVPLALFPLLSLSLPLLSTLYSHSFLWSNSFVPMVKMIMIRVSSVRIHAS